MNEQKTERKPRTMTSDPEVQAMAKISLALNGLDAETRARVVAWAAAKWPAWTTIKANDA